MKYNTRLRVLVNEHQRVGHVVVPQVDDRGADPRPDPLLRLVQNVLVYVHLQVVDYI